MWMARSGQRGILVLAFGEGGSQIAFGGLTWG
jgi:hypothetical protein